MFTYDGLRRVNCSLQGSKVLIEGKSYEIRSRVRSEKSADIGSAIVIAVVTIVAGAEGFREYFEGDRIGSLFLLVPFLISAPVTYYTIRIVVIVRKCRSQWVINRYHPLYIELTDDPEVEHALMSLPVSDGTDLPNPSRTIMMTKRDAVILLVLLLVSAACYWLRAPYWAEVTLLSGLYIIFIRVKDVKNYFMRLKWQSDIEYSTTRE